MLFLFYLLNFRFFRNPVAPLPSSYSIPSGFCGLFVMDDDGARSLGLEDSAGDR